jgi:hypothetical protein
MGASLGIALAGCASGWVTVPVHLDQALATDPQGQRLAALLQQTGYGATLANPNRSFTVLVPLDAAWPAAYGACLTAHPAAARAEAGRYVLTVRWGLHLPSPVGLQMPNAAGGRTRIVTTAPDQALVEGVPTVGAVTPWGNGNTIHLMAPLPPDPTSVCAGAGTVSP